MATVRFHEVFRGHSRYCFINGCDVGAIETANFADHFTSVHGSQLMVGKNTSEFFIAFPYDLDAKEGDVRVPCLIQIDGLHFAFTALFHGNEYKFWVYYLEGRYNNQIRTFTAQLLWNCKRATAFPGKVYPVSYNIERILNIWAFDPEVGITISRDELMRESLAQRKMGMGKATLYIHVQLHLLDLSQLPVISEYTWHKFKTFGEIKVSDLETAADVGKSRLLKNLDSEESDDSDEEDSSRLDDPNPFIHEDKLEPRRRLNKIYLDFSTVQVATDTKQKAEESQQGSLLSLPEKIDNVKRDASTETDEAVVDNSNVVGSSGAAVAKSNDNSVIPRSSSIADIRLNKDLTRMKIYCPNCSCLIMQSLLNGPSEGDEAGDDIKLDKQFLQQINPGGKEQVKTEQGVPKPMSSKTMQELAYIIS